MSWLQFELLLLTCSFWDLDLGDDLCQDLLALRQLKAELLVFILRSLKQVGLGDRYLICSLIVWCYSYCYLEDSIFINILCILSIVSIKEWIGISNKLLLTSLISMTSVHLWTDSVLLLLMWFPMRVQHDLLTIQSQLLTQWYKKKVLNQPDYMLLYW